MNDVVTVNTRAVPDITEGSIPGSLDELDKMINLLGGSIDDLQERIKGFLVPEDSDEKSSSDPDAARRRRSDVSERLNSSIIDVNKLRCQVNNISERVNI